VLQRSCLCCLRLRSRCSRWCSRTRVGAVVRRKVSCSEGSERRGREGGRWEERRGETKATDTRSGLGFEQRSPILMEMLSTTTRDWRYVLCCSFSHSELRGLAHFELLAVVEQHLGDALLNVISTQLIQDLFPRVRSSHSHESELLF